MFNNLVGKLAHADAEGEHLACHFRHGFSEELLLLHFQDGILSSRTDKVAKTAAGVDDVLSLQPVVGASASVGVHLNVGGILPHAGYALVLDEPFLQDVLADEVSNLQIYSFIFFKSHSFHIIY